MVCLPRGVAISASSCGVTGVSFKARRATGHDAALPGSPPRFGAWGPPEFSPACPTTNALYPWQRQPCEERDLGVCTYSLIVFVLPTNPQEECANTSTFCMRQGPLAHYPESTGRPAARRRKMERPDRTQQQTPARELSGPRRRGMRRRATSRIEDRRAPAATLHPNWKGADETQWADLLSAGKGRPSRDRSPSSPCCRLV